MQTTNSIAPTSTNTSIFELKQRKYDGAWEVWIQRDELSLGILDAAKYEAAGRPVYMNPPVWVIAAVYKSKPSVDTVLTALGFKPKAKPQPTKVRTTTLMKPKAKIEQAAAA